MKCAINNIWSQACIEETQNDLSKVDKHRWERCFVQILADHKSLSTINLPALQPTVYLTNTLLRNYSRSCTKSAIVLSSNKAYGNCKLLTANKFIHLYYWIVLFQRLC